MVLEYDLFGLGIEEKDSILHEHRIFSIRLALRMVESKKFSILLAKDGKNERTILNAFEECRRLRVI